MSELDPQARRILLAARAARSPEATDKARVRRRLAAALGGAAVAAQATQAAATASSQTAASASSTVASTALPTATGGATKGALGALGNLAKPVLAKWIVGSTLAVGVGVGEAGGSPPSHSIVSDIFPTEQRATALSIYSLGVYGGILVGVAFFRELLGSGTLFGFQVVPQVAYDMGYVNMGLMVLAPGAFILLGLFIWAQRTYTGYTEEA